MERMLSMSHLAVALATLVTPIGQSSHPSPIRAYRDQAVFSTAPAGSKTFTLQLADPDGVPSTGRRGSRAAAGRCLARA